MKDLPLTEITLRKYEKPYGLEKREMLRKICLSLGLLQLGDSRDIVVDIMSVLIDGKKEKKQMTSNEIKELVEKQRQKYNLPLKGVAESNIRRQLKRLRDIMLVEKTQNKYRITEFADLEEIFEKRVEKFIIPQTIERIKEYLKEVDKL